MNPLLARLGPLLVVTALVAACGSNGDQSAAGRVRPAETAIPDGVKDPRVAPAVAAYQLFQSAVAHSQEKPLAAAGEYPEGSDFTRYSFEPISTEFEAEIKRLKLANGQFRGTPPTSNVTVVSIDPDANPWPEVTLSDCQTGQAGWQAVDTRTGDPLPDIAPRVPRPYGITISMVYNQQHWGVNTMSMDPDRTCPD